MGAQYLTDVTLPTKGLLYDDSIPSKMTLRSTTTKEEKMIFGSANSNGVARALKSCVVEPTNLDLKKLVPADEHYLLMKLRIHSYGSDYNVSAKCSHCNKSDDYTINLDNLVVHELDDDFVEPINIGELPVSGDSVEVKLLRNSDYEFINEQAKKMSKKLGVPFDELEYTMRMARHVKSVNGEELTFAQAQIYVEEMVGKDSAYFWSKLDDIEIGYDTVVSAVCNSCGEEFDFVLPMNGEFFRPKFR